MAGEPRSPADAPKTVIDGAARGEAGWTETSRRNRRATEAPEDAIQGGAIGALGGHNGEARLTFERGAAKMRRERPLTRRDDRGGGGGSTRGVAFLSGVRSGKQGVSVQYGGPGHRTLSETRQWETAEVADH